MISALLRALFLSNVVLALCSNPCKALRPTKATCRSGFQPSSNSEFRGNGLSASLAGGGLWCAGSREGFHYEHTLRLRGGGDLKVVSAHGRADADATAGLSFISVFRRALILLLVFSFPVGTMLPAAIFSPFRESVWYPMLGWSIGHSGAAFIKWGQWASVRPDMFPEKLCDQLSTLHASAPLHSWDFTRKSVETELGAKLEDYFESFERKAIASGSIAQVYVAWRNGQKLAVKVRHPGVEEQIMTDFSIMQAVGKFVDSVPGLGWVNARASMEQFSHTIAAQTRLDIEGNHLDIFNRNFRGATSRCGFPTVLFKSHSVLIETFEEGQVVTQLVVPYTRHCKRIARQRGAPSPEESVRTGRCCGALSWLWRAATCCFGPAVASEEEKEVEVEVDMSLGHFIVTQGTNVYLQMLLSDNLMHADLHPGNILVQHGDPEKGVSPRIVLVDAGMVAQLTVEEQNNFIGFLQAMGEGDGEDAAEKLLGFSSKQTCSTPERRDRFISAMSGMFKTECRGYHTNVDVGNVLRNVLVMLRVHQVRIDVNYATLVLNVLCLEGLACFLQPGYNLLDGAKPLLRNYRPWARPLFAVTRRVKQLQDRREYWQLRREHTATAGIPTTSLVDVALSPAAIGLAAVLLGAVPWTNVEGVGGGNLLGLLLRDLGRLSGVRWEAASDDRAVPAN